MPEIHLNQTEFGYLRLFRPDLTPVDEYEAFRTSNILDMHLQNEVGRCAVLPALRQAIEPVLTKFVPLQLDAKIVELGQGAGFFSHPLLLRG